MRTRGWVGIAAATVSLGLLAAGGSMRAVAGSQKLLVTGTFPAGTVLVTYDALHGRTYFAVGSVIREQGTGVQFTTGSPQSMEVSADGNRLLVRCQSESFVLEAEHLRPVRRLDTPYTWWEGHEVGYYRVDGHGRGFLFTRGGERRIGSGEVGTGRTRILSADSKGRYFLGVRRLSRGTEENGFNPSNRLELWEKSEGGELGLVRTLTAVEYDPASVGDPHRLEALAGQVVVFGYPLGAALDEDLVGVLRGGRVTAPLADVRGRGLWFAQAPLVAGDAIVGLAIAEGQGPSILDPTMDRYLYRVSEAALSLTPVASGVVFVTYDPKLRRIGLGMAGKDGVSIEWQAATPVPATSAQARRVAAVPIAHGTAPSR